MDPLDALLALLWENYAYVRDAYAIQQPAGHYITWRQTLEPAILRAHLAGEISIATYLLRADDTCLHGALDHDDLRLTAQGERVEESGVAVLTQARDRLRALGGDGALFWSGRGAHLHVYAAAPVPAALMRQLLALVMGEERWQRQAHGERGVEVFPKSATRGGGLGSNLRVPFGVHRRYGRRFGLVDVTPERDAQAEALARIQPTDVAGLLAGVPRAERDAVRAAERRSGVAPPPLPFGERRRAGPIAEWTSRVSTRYVAELLGARFPSGATYGHCPRPERHRHNDEHPSFQCYRDSAWRCWTEDVYGSNAFDLVAWWLGYDHTTLSGDDARTVLAECQRLVP